MRPVGTPGRHFTIAAIQAAACFYYHEAPEALLGEARHRPLAQRRQVAMAMCRRLTDQSYPAIARAFRRDHTTVIYAVRAVFERERAETAVVAEMANITAIARTLSEHHRALGTRFLLSRIEAAAAVGRFLAELPFPSSTFEG